MKRLTWTNEKQVKEVTFLRDIKKSDTLRIKVEKVNQNLPKETLTNMTLTNKKRVNEVTFLKELGKSDIEQVKKNLSEELFSTPSNK